MPIAISAEQRALQASIRDWAQRAGTLALVRRLEPGAQGAASPDPVPPAMAPWADHWAALAELGIFSIALPEAAGGDGGTVADLAAALEQLTVALAPGPVLPTLLAGLLLRDHPDLPAAKELLPPMAAGQASVAVALGTGTITGAWLPDGTLRVSGETGPVLGGGATTHLLLGAGTGDGEAWFVLPAGHARVQVTARAPVDFSRPLAGIRLTGVVAAPGDLLAGLHTTAVRDLAATLFCAEAAGVAGRTGAECARGRRRCRSSGRPPRRPRHRTGWPPGRGRPWCAARHQAHRCRGRPR